MTLTQIDSQTKTAAFVGAGVSISGIAGAWTLKLNMQSLSSSDGSTPIVRFEFDDSVNSFTASIAGPTCSFQGANSLVSDQVKSWKQQDFPDLRFGVSNALIRLQVSDLSANATVQYRAWLEY